MTKREFLEKYGHVKVKFVNYYKYTFMYETVLPDGTVVVCGCGGTADDIYRREVVADKEETIVNIRPHIGYAHKEGAKSEYFYDY